MLIRIPFQGFYSSVHEGEFEDFVWNRMFTDWKTGTQNNDTLSAKAAFNWSKIRKEYAKLYADQFAHEYKLQITFDSLESPREYNFETDRIFCEIDGDSVLHMWRSTSREVLEKYIKEYCTSRSGFHSFYSNDFSEWPHNPLKYDHNELYILCFAYLDCAHDVEHGEVDQAILERLSSCGHIDNLMYNHCTTPRLLKIHSYLQGRADRRTK